MWAGLPRAFRVIIVAAGMALSLSMTDHAAAQPDVLADCQREESLPEYRIKNCSKIIEDDAQPADIRAEAYLNRGVAYEEFDNLPDAIEDYTQAIMLNPEYRALFHYRGLAYDKEGKTDLAIADFSEAIRLDPKDTEALVYRGLSYAAIGQHDKALSDFDAALAEDPDDSSALAGRGETYEAKGQRDKAIADFRRALEVDPENEDAADGLKRLGAKR